MKNKQCNKCNRTLSLESFYDKKRSKVREDGTVHKWTGKYSSCIDCVNTYNEANRYKYDAYYKKYREINKKKISSKSKVHYIKKHLDWISLIKLKKELKCEKCGYDRTFAGLDFHHINPTSKDISIHQIIQEGIPNENRWIKMEKELSKCTVLCATCHREEHMVYNWFKEDGWGDKHG